MMQVRQEEQLIAAGWKRRQFVTMGLAAFGALPLAGCASFFGKKGDEQEVHSLPYDDADEVEYVGELTDPWGLGYAKVESVALVTGLQGTGSNPEHSSARTRLLNEMKLRQVADAEGLLSSKNTSLVVVQAYLPPGIRRGETHDVFVQLPPGSRGESLKGGVMMPARLKPMEVLDRQLRTGQVMSNAGGLVIIDSSFEPEGEESLQRRGVVLGGGRASITRPFGLVCRPDVASVAATTAISSAINHRFSAIDSGERKGVANPKDDELIDLLLPKEYQFHLGRYIQVIRSIVVEEYPEERIARMERLGRELRDPLLAARAAMRLEAIGHDASQILIDALASPQPETQFYAAESLAYMGYKQAAPVLGRVAAQSASFRWHAMTALASMGDIEASSELANLLHADEIETRYAAFRALHSHSPNDSAVRGVLIQNDFYYHVVASNAPPVVHFSRAKRPEIVLFGHQQQVSDDLVYVQYGLNIRGNRDGTVTMTRFVGSSEDQTVTCSTQLDDIFRTMMLWEYDYEELLSFARAVDGMGALQGQFVVHAVPDPSRPLQSDELLTTEPIGAGHMKNRVGQTMPDLYRRPTGGVELEDEEETSFPPDSFTEPPKKRSFFGRMTGWWKS